MNSVSIYTDGGSRGNPGKSGIGIVIYDHTGELIQEHGEYIGIGTNNEAEYKAVVKAFELLSTYSNIELHFYCDSLLVVKQLKGEYKIKNARMKALWEKIKSVEQKFKSVSYHHIPREKNTRADFLVNEALDKYK